jgi:hypothetical protein
MPGREKARNEKRQGWADSSSKILLGLETAVDWLTAVMGIIANPPSMMSH